MAYNHIIYHLEIFQIFLQHLGRVQDQLFQMISSCSSICYRNTRAWNRHARMHTQLIDDMSDKMKNKGNFSSALQISKNNGNWIWETYVIESSGKHRLACMQAEEHKARNSTCQKQGFPIIQNAGIQKITKIATGKNHCFAQVLNRQVQYLSEMIHINLHGKLSQLHLRQVNP